MVVLFFSFRNIPMSSSFSDFKSFRKINFGNNGITGGGGGGNEIELIPKNNKIINFIFKLIIWFFSFESGSI